MAMNTTPKLKGSSTGKFDEDWVGTDGAAHVRNMEGTGNQLRARDAQNVGTTPVTREWPSGSNITSLQVFCTYNDTATVGADPSDYGHVRGQLAIDAIDDATAALMLTYMNTEADDSLLYEIPVNQFITINLGSALVNGSLGGGCVHFKSNNATYTLDFWIGGQ